MGFTEAFYKLPNSIQTLLDRSVKQLKPNEIFLFGSRARGDFRDDSDFDLAFSLTAQGKKNWSRFLSEVDENAVTLLKVDLVEMSGLDSVYLENIKKEGTLLYGNLSNSKL